MSKIIDEENDVITYEELGGIGCYKTNCSRAFVQTYSHDEVQITLVGETGIETNLFIRIRIGTNDGKQILMLDNNKFYIVDSYATKVRYTEEISPSTIFANVLNIDMLYRLLGDMTQLATVNKTSIVNAVNELVNTSSVNRLLKGSIKYLVDKSTCAGEDDLDIRFNLERQRFEYWSNTGEWVLLPRGFNKLDKIVRTRSELPEKANLNSTCGILDENTVLLYDGAWIEVHLTEDYIGDEYLVQHIYNSEFGGNATGSLIKTQHGWTYLVHYNYK